LFSPAEQRKFKEEAATLIKESNIPLENKPSGKIGEEIGDAEIDKVNEPPPHE